MGRILGARAHALKWAEEGGHDDLNVLGASADALPSPREKSSVHNFSVCFSEQLKQFLLHQRLLSAPAARPAPNPAIHLCFLVPFT